MKLKTSAPRKETPQQQDTEDIEKIYEDLTDQYDQVFIHEFPDYGIFMFKPLGRKDFRELRDTEIIEDYEKEELICEQCVLYPKDFDYENCDEAGLPTQLAQIILDKSLLKDSNQLTKAIHFFRDKVYESLDEQITCIIHEAFPEYKIDEIANWDVMRTAEYMVKAEYILHNLRGVPLSDPEGNEVEYMPPSERQAVQQQQIQQQQQQQRRQQSMEERFKPVDANEAQAIQNSKKKDLTPQQLNELYQKFPGIDWAHDSVAMRGTDALKNQYFDDRPVAEIPIDDSEEGQNAIPPALRDRFKVIREKN